MINVRLICGFHQIRQHFKLDGITFRSKTRTMRLGMVVCSRFRLDNRGFFNALRNRARERFYIQPPPEFHCSGREWNPCRRSQQHNVLTTEQRSGANMHCNRRWCLNYALWIIHNIGCWLRYAQPHEKFVYFYVVYQATDTELLNFEVSYAIISLLRILVCANFMRNVSKENEGILAASDGDVTLIYSPLG